MKKLSEFSAFKPFVKNVPNDKRFSLDEKIINTRKLNGQIDIPGKIDFILESGEIVYIAEDTLEELRKENYCPKSKQDLTEKLESIRWL